MFKGKIKTIRDGINIMKWGSNLRSKKILLLTDLLNHLGYSRNRLRKMIAGQIESSATGDEVHLKFKIKPFASFPVKYRVNDYCDYMGLSECLGDLYKFPEHEVFFFIDAGANIGFFSISMMKHSKAKEAIVIEPNPNNLPLLNYNLSSFKHLSIIPIAVSNKEGEVVFELASSNTGHLRGSIGHLQTDDTVVVKSACLSSLIPLHWSMENTLLKIDIEGAEYEVIPELFDKNYFPQIIVGEIHDYLQSGGEQLVQYLKSFNYSIKVSGFGDIGNVCRQFIAVRINTTETNRYL